MAAALALHVLVAIGTRVLGLGAPLVAGVAWTPPVARVPESEVEVEFLAPDTRVPSSPEFVVHGSSQPHDLNTFAARTGAIPSAALDSGLARGQARRAEAASARPEARSAFDPRLDSSADVEPAPRSVVEPRAPLSLAALGIGDKNPFLRDNGSRGASVRELGRARFERELAGEVARANQAAGLGPEGPVLAALESLVRNGTTAANSSARFRCVTDPNGKLLRVDLLESSSDPRPWKEVADRLLRTLGKDTLRIPKTGRGVTFVIRVTSRIQLPSGADPGLGVSVLGIPIKKGEGPRSAQIEILNVTPKFELQKVPLAAGPTLEVPTLRLGSLLAISGDPADIGAHPQRMVHTHVEKVDVNATEPAASTPSSP